jgi:hypothetical protein
MPTSTHVLPQKKKDTMMFPTTQWREILADRRHRPKGAGASHTCQSLFTFYYFYIYSNIKPSLIWPNNDEKTIVKTRKDYWRSFHWAFCFYLFNIYLNIKLPLSWTYSDKKKNILKIQKKLIYTSFKYFAFNYILIILLCF